MLITVGLQTTLGENRDGSKQSSEHETCHQTTHMYLLNSRTRHPREIWLRARLIAVNSARHLSS